MFSIEKIFSSTNFNDKNFEIDFKIYLNYCTNNFFVKIQTDTQTLS